MGRTVLDFKKRISSRLNEQGLRVTTRKPLFFISQTKNPAGAESFFVF
jgi:hypothetical protein